MVRKRRRAKRRVIRHKTKKKKISQIGKSNVAYDKRLRAKKPGKRISASGKVYYERRANRSDVNPRKRL